MVCVQVALFLESFFLNRVVKDRWMGAAVPDPQCRMPPANAVLLLQRQYLQKADPLTESPGRVES